jgi:hypothetical protein
MVRATIQQNVIAPLLKDTMQLLNIYNIQNFTNLVHNLRDIKYNENIKLCSIDIINMYTNISLADVRNIIKNILNNNNQIPKKKKRN